MAAKLRIGMCQMLVGSCKADNIKKAVGMVAEAKAQGAQLVVLPECFNSPYGTKYFPEYAEELSPKGDTYTAMAQASKEHSVWLVAGSIPERDGDKIYNSSMTFNPNGELVGVFRKMHLFRIKMPELTMDEGETLTGGAAPLVIDVPAGGPANIPAAFKFGLGICFDIRFPQLALHYAAAGTSLLVCPGAFSTTTGPKYWQMLSRARASDSQQYVAMVSPARDEGAGYIAYGHSLLTSPLGDVLVEADEKECVSVADVDLDAVTKARQMLPVLSGTRHDLYSVKFHEQ